MVRHILCVLHTNFCCTNNTLIKTPIQAKAIRQILLKKIREEAAADNPCKILYSFPLHELPARRLSTQFAPCRVVRKQRTNELQGRL